MSALLYRRTGVVEAQWFDGSLESAESIITWLGSGYECSRITYDSKKSPHFHIHLCGNAAAPGGYQGGEVFAEQWVTKQVYPSWEVKVWPEDTFLVEWEEVDG